MAVTDQHEVPVDPGDGEAGWKRWLLPAALAAGLLLGGWLVLRMMDGRGEGPRRQTVKIAVLPDTPPPPPPPKEEKKPEPDKPELKPQPQEQPKPQEAPPEPQQLKMDGPAGDGPSAFAAGSVTSEYKGGEVGTGVGGGNRMQFAFFASQLQRHIQNHLAREQSIKLGDYRVPVQVWLSASGAIERIELMASSGSAETDEALRKAFSQMPPVRDMPAQLPQPIRLRITNRMTG